MTQSRWRCYVLAGGRSSRFGSNKADADWDGRTFTEATAAALARLGDVSLVVARGSQPSAGTPFRSLCDASPEERRHPIYGFAAALADAKHSEAGVLIAAVDQPFLRVEWLQTLVSAADETQRPAAFRNSLWQPTPLAVPAKVVAEGLLICERLLTPPPRMQEVLEQLDAVPTDLPDGWPPKGSINRPEDRSAVG